MRCRFNGLCDFCKIFKPRCVTVYLKSEPTRPVVLCEACKKKVRGEYQLDRRHG